MNQTATETAGGSRGVHRRFPHLTARDVEILDRIEREQGRTAAREFERLVRSQHTAERAFRVHETVEADLGADVEFVSSARHAASAGGPGGGRRR